MEKINSFENSLKSLIASAQTLEDLNAIGLKLNEAINNNYSLNAPVIDYQIGAAKKMGEIYNKLGKKV